MASVKIIGLLIKTLSKPIAKSLKRSATTHPSLQKVCISIAQKTHSLEHSLKLKFLEYDSKAIHKPLSESRALESGADFLSEFFLFVVAGSVVVAEGVRTRLSAKSKSEDVNIKISNLEKDLDSLQEKIQNLTKNQQDILK